MTDSFTQPITQKTLLVFVIVLFFSVFAVPTTSFAQGTYRYFVSLSDSSYYPVARPVMGASVLVRHSLYGDSIGVIGNSSLGPGFVIDFPCQTGVPEDISFYVVRADSSLSNIYSSRHYSPGNSSPNCDQNGQEVLISTEHLVLRPDDGIRLTPYQNLQNSGSTCGNQSVGKPVNVTNGNMWLQEMDYVLPGVGEFINLTRTYNSESRANGIFGVGWTSAYDERLIGAPDNNIQLRLGSGRGILFAKTGFEFLPITPGFYGKIVQSGDYLTLTFNDGRVHTFNSRGMLISMTDRLGRTTALSYDNSNYELSSITDASGRILSILSNQGRIQSVSDTLGLVASYNYNTDGTLQSVNYPDGSKHQYEYVTIGDKAYLTTVRNGLNNILETHQYDSQGRAITSEIENGVELYTFDFSHLDDSTDPYTTVTDALGRQTKYTFDKSQGKNVVTKIEGHCSCGSGQQTIAYFYDSQQNVIKTVDSLGREINSTYDNDGNLLTITDSQGTETFTYNDFGQVLTSTDEMGAVWTNIYDSQGKLTQTTDPINGDSYIVYNTNNLPELLVKARNNGPNWAVYLYYDAYGNLIEKSQYITNYKTYYSYDARSRLTSVTNPLGHITSYEYDPVGRVKKITDPLLKTVEFGYDLAGRQTSVKDARGFTTTYGYDSANRLINTTDPLNHTKSYGYDLMSNLLSQTDAVGNTTNYEYDAFNRIIKVIYPAAETGATRLQETLEYDAVGNLKKKIDTANRQTLYDYDVADRLIKTTDRNGQITQYEYNARNQMTKVTDALNQVYQFTYDPLGNILTETRAGLTKSYVYDVNGDLKKRTDYNGTVTNYAYDSMGRLKTVKYPNAAENITFTYDALSRLQKATNYAGTVDFNYTKRSQISEATDVHGRKVNYTYDAAGNANKMLLDDVEQVDYQFDGAGRLQKITDSEAGNFVDYNYDAANRLIKKILPNGISTNYQYDGMSRLTRLRDFKTNTDNSQTNLYNRQYGYNPAGNISQIKIGSQTKTFTYDTLDRLTQVATSGVSQNENYSYDAVGNRTSSNLLTSYSYQPYNRLSATATANFTYDANGNLTSRTDVTSGTTQYTWDYENRLRQVVKPNGETVSYKYDALGRRIEKSVNSQTWTKFTYDGQDVILDANSDGTTIKYLNGPGTDDKLSLKANGQTKYFIQDHLGSTNALTDASGNVTDSANYDSFGNVTGNLPTRYQYTGREYDADTGLYYYRARWYSSETGRFISEDPIGLAGGINQFGYVGGNPVSFSDPSGLYPDGQTMVIDEARRFIFSPESIEFGQMVSTPEGRAVIASGGSAIVVSGKAAIAYGGTSVAAAGAAPIALTVGGGLAIGGAIGLPIGIYTANLPGNPFVNGSWNPYGKSAAEVEKEPWTPQKPKQSCDDDDDENGKELVLGVNPYDEELRSELASQNRNVNYTTYIDEKGPKWTEANFMELANSSRKIHFELRYGFDPREYAIIEKRLKSAKSIDDVEGYYTYKEFYLITNRGLRGKTKFYEK